MWLRYSPCLWCLIYWSLTLKKWRLYGCFSLESATFVVVMTKVIANEVKV